MKNIAVIGAGTMGNGIAHVFAQNNFNVSLVDIQQDYLDKAILTITKNLDRQIKKEIITETDKEKTLSNIKKVVGIENIPAETDLVVEAIIEDRDLKLSIFKKLESQLKPEAIFASNTSSISITELSAVCRADRFIGMHFMNPVPVMKLVEIIRGYSTSDETYNSIKELAETLGKTPVEVHDYPGFIANRILMPMINEAVFSLYEGVASAVDIDTVMKLGMNHPMGPLTLADFIGLDVCLAIMDVLYEGFNDSKYRPCPLLKKMVAAGKLGRKSGEGFFQY
ncbi:MAG: 3-hydroxybutyryl-CoA dehydrogenase [Ignavibacteriae bacterium]|nr:3-hydroxybutyryl-CoA dehydrogenase [Ignavibacteriota bacterium]NOG96567.1 3-hydroxybutyryl-CoA dehydrogenase [Ignavibacteriota bacterium]